MTTLENHVTEGGIGSLDAETIADVGVGKHLILLGLEEAFPHGGSRGYLMWHYGLEALALVRDTEDLVGDEVGSTGSDLEAACVGDVHTLAKAEALRRSVLCQLIADAP